MRDIQFFDGLEYVSAVHAAKAAKLARDYVTKLCREGKVDGKQVGTKWYVNENSLAAFLAEQEVIKRHRSAERSQQVKSAYDQHDSLMREQSQQLALETQQAAPKLFSRTRLLLAGLVLLCGIGSASAMQTFEPMWLHSAQNSVRTSALSATTALPNPLQGAFN